MLNLAESKSRKLLFIYIIFVVIFFFSLVIYLSAKNNIYK
jgi:hypothetical protein